MKKAIACLLTLCIVVAMAAVGATAAAPTVRLSSPTARVGESVKMTLSLVSFSAVTDPDGSSSNKPIDTLFSAVQLKIYYDASKFEVSEYKAADEAAGKPSPCKLGDDFVTDIIRRSDAQGDYIYLSVMCVSGNGVTLSASSAIVEITIKVKDGVTTGEYDFKSSGISLVTGIKGQPKNVISQFTLAKGALTVLSGLRGDLDGDGKVDVSDVIMMRNWIMEGNPTPERMTKADLDSDGKIDVSDVIMLRNIIMGTSASQINIQPFCV